MNIGIFAVYATAFDEKSIELPLGGSETWAIQLADAFRALGHGVTVVCGCAERHTTETGAEYVPIREFEKGRGWTFDLAIASRYWRDFLRLWAGRGKARRVFLQLHDDHAPNTNGALVGGTLADKIVTLTDWHRRYIQEKYSLRDEDMAVIPNPVDARLFPDVDVERRTADHAVLWSSCPTRGLEILAKYVAPLVRQAVPDFSVKAVTYSQPEQRRCAGLEDVEWLEPMNKRQLYAEMCKHAVWFYPSVFDETFCITLAENAYAGNHIVMHPDFGTTEFAGISDNVVAPFWTGHTFRTACAAAARKIADRVLRYGEADCAARRAEARKFVAERFSPERVAELYVRTYEESLR